MGILKTKENAMVLEQPTKTERRFGFEREPLKIPADEIQSAIQQLMSGEPKVPVPIANAAFATVWLLKVGAFRAKEDEYLVQGKFEEALPEHRVILADLIADGEAIISGVKKNGMADTPGSFKLADLESTLNSLHTSFRCEHGPKNSPKMNQMIEGLFNGEKS